MSLQTDVAKFNALLNDSTNNPNDLQAHFCLLAHINTYRLPYPQLVLQYGKQLIDAYNPKTTLLISPFSFWASLWSLINPDPIREHIFDIIEQTCLAAISCHHYNLRNDCLYLLEHFFNGSIRVLFLRGQIYESAERYEEALVIYRRIIKENHDTGYVLRAKQRIIAIGKEFGHYDQVLTDLNTFTMMYSGCYDGWFELYQVNLRMGGQEDGKYSLGAILAAAHLLLLEPEDYMSHNYNGDALMSYANICGLKKFSQGQSTLCDWWEYQTLDGNDDNIEAKSTTLCPLVKHRDALQKKGVWDKMKSFHKGTTMINQNTVKAKTITQVLNQPPIDDDIRMIYDHLISARFYYSTSFHLHPNQIAAVGLIMSSKRIKGLLGLYPTLPNSISTLPNSSNSQHLNQKQLESEGVNQQALLDCIDLIQIAIKFISATAAERCSEQMKIGFANQRRQQRGFESLPPIITLDPFSVIYYYKQNGSMGEECGG